MLKALGLEILSSARCCTKVQQNRENPALNPAPVSCLCGLASRIGRPHSFARPATCGRVAAQIGLTSVAASGNRVKPARVTMRQVFPVVEPYDVSRLARITFYRCALNQAITGVTGEAFWNAPERFCGACRVPYPVSAAIFLQESPGPPQIRNPGGTHNPAGRAKSWPWSGRTKGSNKAIV